MSISASSLQRLVMEYGMEVVMAEKEAEAMVRVPEEEEGVVRGPHARHNKSVVQCLSCMHPAEPDPVALPGRLLAATAPANANTTFFFV